MEVRVSPQVDELLKLSQNLKEYEDRVRSGKTTQQDVAVTGRTSIEEAMKNKVAEIISSGVNENDIKAFRDIVASLPDGDQRQTMKIQLRVLEAKLDEQNKKQEQQENKNTNLLGSDNSNKSSDKNETKEEKEAREFREGIEERVDLIKKTAIGVFNEAGEMVDYAQASIIQVSKNAGESVMNATKSLVKVFENIGIETIVQENQDAGSIAYAYRMPKGFEHLDPTQMSQQDIEKMLLSRREQQSNPSQESQSSNNDSQQPQFKFKVVGAMEKDDLMAFLDIFKVQVIAKETAKIFESKSEFASAMLNSSNFSQDSKLTNVLSSYLEDNLPNNRNSNQR